MLTFGSKCPMPLMKPLKDESSSDDGSANGCNFTPCWLVGLVGLILFVETTLYAIYIVFD